MGQIGPWQILIIVLLVVLVFGAKRLPDTARALGKSLRILKSETAAMKTDGESASGSSGDKDTDQTSAPRTIQAAPGDVSSARPVEEPKGSAQS